MGKKVKKAVLVSLAVVGGASILITAAMFAVTLPLMVPDINHRGFL